MAVNQNQRKKSVLFILNAISFILTAFHSFGNFPPHGPSDPTLSTYKDWGFGPDTVFGIVPLSKTNYRSYVKISRVNSQLYIISKFNPADVLVNTTQVKFNDGGLSLITETNQWGEHFDSAWFIPLAPGKFLCIRRERGVKEEPLCKFEKLVYNKGLLEEKSSLSDTNTLCNNREAVAIYKYKRYEDKWTI